MMASLFVCCPFCLLILLFFFLSLKYALPAHQSIFKLNKLDCVNELMYVHAGAFVCLCEAY